MVGRVCAAFRNVRQSVPSRWTGMSKSTASVGWHPDPRDLQSTTIIRSEMFVAVDAGDRSREINQVSRSYAVLTQVHKIKSRNYKKKKKKENILPIKKCSSNTTIKNNHATL